MGGDHHHGEENIVKKVKIPDYTKYKWEEIPQLVQLQERLGKVGLKDPWARNHVWKYLNPYSNNKTLPWYKFYRIPGFPRGAAYGFAALGIYIGIDQLFHVGRKGHGHGGHGHSEVEDH